MAAVRDMKMDVAYEAVESQEQFGDQEVSDVILQRPRGILVGAAMLAVVAGTVALMALMGPLDGPETSDSLAKSLPEAKYFAPELDEVEEDVRFVREVKPMWINRNPEYLELVKKAKSENRKTELAERRLALTDPVSCELSLNRFKTIDAMAGATTFAYGQDPNFPATEDSISVAGENCGDTAQGINDPCTKYNKWANMADISKAKGFSTFNVFPQPANMPTYEDIEQGELGTCYFLGALLSIAHENPQILKDMFVRTDRWSEGIFTTKWLINGRESYIEVDQSIPSPDGERTFFSHMARASGAWWVPILEKSWSKVFKNFKAAEAGLWSNVAGAITRAPTVDINHRTTSASDGEKERVWALLLEGVANKWPMGAGTDSSHYGLAAGHQYSVLWAGVDASYGNIVRVRNPWHADNYKGAIPNAQSDDGTFEMKYDEYFEAFSETSVAKVSPGYKVSSAELSTASNLQDVYKFQATTNKVFYVSVVWPGHRIVKPCEGLTPSYMVAVRNVVSGKVMSTKSYQSGNNAAVVEVNPEDGGGAGQYVVAVSISFPSGDWVTSAYMNIYAEETIDLYRESDFAHVALGMVAANVGGTPCDNIMTPHGLFSVDYTKTVGGLASYWAYDKGSFAYWSGSQGTWNFIGSDKWTEVAAGGLWAYSTDGKLAQSALSCGCSDSSTGVKGFTGITCSMVKSPNIKYGNVACGGTAVQYTELVSTYCPTTCEVSVCSKAAPEPMNLSPAPVPAPTPSAPAGPVPVPSPPPSTPVPEPVPEPVPVPVPVPAPAPTPAVSEPAAGDSAAGETAAGDSAAGDSKSGGSETSGSGEVESTPVYDPLQPHEPDGTVGNEFGSSR